MLYLVSLETVSDIMHLLWYIEAMKRKIVYNKIKQPFFFFKESKKKKNGKIKSTTTYLEAFAAQLFYTCCRHNYCLEEKGMLY